MTKTTSCSPKKEERSHTQQSSVRDKKGKHLGKRMGGGPKVRGHSPGKGIVNGVFGETRKKYSTSNLGTSQGKTGGGVKKL